MRLMVFKFSLSSKYDKITRPVRFGMAHTAKRHFDRELIPAAGKKYDTR